MPAAVKKKSAIEVLQERFEVYEMKKETPVPQKIRGLQALRAHTVTGPTGPVPDLNRMGTTVPAFAIILPGDPFPTYKPAPVIPPFFARPAPPRPTHGGLDSEVCNTWAGVKKFWEKLKKEHPDWGLIIMHYLGGHYASAVLAGGKLDIGLGSDAATQGRDVVSLQVPPVPLHDSLLRSAGVTETPYLEFVGGFLVQLRDGPKLPDTHNFIPAELAGMHPAVVLRPEDYDNDIFAWEVAIEGAKVEAACMSADGHTPVAHLPGSGLASHFAVHAIQHGIPVIVDQEVPEPLPLLGTPNTHGHEFTAKFRAGLKSGMETQLSVLDGRDTLLTALAILHASGPLGLSKAGILLVGWATAIIWRYGVMACAGEARHVANGGDRESVWNATAQHHNVMDLSKILADSFEAFINKRWENGYGGIAWAGVAASLIKVAKAFYHRNRCITNLNTAVTVAHNGGCWLEKFGIFDQALADLSQGLGGIVLARKAGLLYDVVTSSPEDYKNTDLHNVGTVFNNLRWRPNCTFEGDSILLRQCGFSDDDDERFIRISLNTTGLPDNIKTALHLIGTIRRGYED